MSNEMKKFYNFNYSNDVTDLYLYGAITSDKWSDNEVDSNDFRNALELTKDNGTLNIYCNSPGGEVFVTDAIISMITRAKQTKNINVDFYADGLCASCASWLPMIADNIYIYDCSMFMLHKPMSSVWSANANDMLKQIELLDKIEDSMLSSYMLKAKEGITEEYIKDLLAKETWLNSKDIQEVFNVELLTTDKKLVACVDTEVFNRYKNIPKELLQVEEPISEPISEPIAEPIVDKVEPIVEIDNSIDMELELMSIELSL